MHKFGGKYCSISDINLGCINSIYPCVHPALLSCPTLRHVFIPPVRGTEQSKAHTTPLTTVCALNILREK